MTDPLPTALRRQREILAAARRTVDKFLGTVAWQDVLPDVIADVGSAAGVSRVWISENLGGEDGELYSRRIAEWDAGGVTSQHQNRGLQGYPYDAGGLGRWRQVLGGGGTIDAHVGDLPTTERQLLASHGVVSVVAVPVFVDTQWWGVVGFDECRERRAWSDEELVALRTAASTIGSAIEQQRLRQELREREVQYRQVFEARTDGLAITDLSGVLVEGNPAFYAMHGYDDGELLGRHMSTWTHPDDLDTNKAHVAAARAGGAVQLHSRHLRKDGTSFAVDIQGVSIDFGGRRHVLAEVRDVTERVDMTRLLEQRVTALADVAATLVVDQPLQELLDQLTAAAVHAGRTVAAAVLVADEDTGTLSSVSTAGLPAGYEAGLRESWLAGVDSPTAAALRAQRVQVVRDAPANALANRRYAPLHQLLRGVAWDTILVLPLDSLGRCLGSLNVYYSAEEEPEADEVAFLSAVANQAAVAVENARLLGEGRQRAADLERHRLARDLHDSVSQALFSMTLHARTAQLAMTNAGLPDDGPLGRAVRQMRDLTQGALAEMRALIFELRPGALTEEGLVAAVSRQAAAVSAREGLAVRVQGPAGRLGLSAPAEEHLYRIVLEALHNAVKHVWTSTAPSASAPRSP